MVENTKMFGIFHHIHLHLSYKICQLKTVHMFLSFFFFFCTKCTLLAYNICENFTCAHLCNDILFNTSSFF